MSPESSAEGIKTGPKYRRIYLDLREQLANGTYGQGNKLPSESEMVASFGASRPTIRRALAQLESEGFIQRRMGAGTTVSARARHHNHVFGLLIPELGMTEIFEPICQGISQPHADSQHDLLWGPSSAPGVGKEVQAQNLCRYYIDRKVSGVFFAPMELIVGQDEANLTITGAFDEARIPVILLDRDIALFPKRSKYDLVGIDNHRAGYMLAEHLILSGSRRIAFLARPNSAHSVNLRIGGYHAALLAHFGAEARPVVKWIDASDVAGVQKFLIEARPDAIQCANDYTAAQVLTTLSAIGIQVPAHIRVAGVDDLKYARLLQTPLTTIHQPCRELGATALRAMLSRIAHPNGPSIDYFVDFELKIRRSSEQQSSTLAEMNVVEFEPELPPFSNASATSSRPTNGHQGRANGARRRVHSEP